MKTLFLSSFTKLYVVGRGGLDWREDVFSLGHWAFADLGCGMVLVYGCLDIKNSFLVRIQSKFVFYTSILRKLHPLISLQE